MEITEVKVFPNDGQDKKLKAYTTITFENKFVVHRRFRCFEFILSNPRIKKSLSVYPFSAC